MKMQYVYLALVIIVIGSVVVLKQYGGAENGKDRTTRYDAFAICLKDAGAKFYGAYWCPHCQAQKKQFANSIHIPYIECSTPNGQAQTAECTDAKIASYPTWMFSDGTRLDGEQTLEVLAQKTQCALPSE